MLLLSNNLYAQPVGKGVVSIVEEDGSPEIFPWQIKVSNTNLTDNGDGTASLNTMSGGNVGIGTVNFIPVYVGVSTLGPSNIVHVAGNIGIASLAPGARLDVQGTGRFSTAVNSPAISNLTSNGFVTTTGGTGTLSVDTASYTPTTRTLTVAGTANQITSSAGAQDLSANRTWTLSTPQDIATTSAVQFGNIGIGTSLTGTSALTVMNGNVGIGTWKPTKTLDVVGTGNFSSTLTASNLSGTNTGDVTLAGTPDYITISGQAITRAKLDMADDLNTFASSVLLGNLTDEVGTGVAVFNASPNFTGNVGIGTTTPQAALAVPGNVGIGTWTADNGKLIVMGGNVGIGTWSPLQTVQVNSGSMLLGAGTGIADTNRLIQLNTPTNTVRLISWVDGTTSLGYIDYERRSGIWSGQGLALNDSSGNGIIFGVSSSDTSTVRMKIDANGNVGIGTTVPQFPLQVFGNVGVGTTVAASTPYQLVINNVATFNSVFQNASNIGVGTTTINWNNGNSQNIGIGTSQGAYLAFTHPTQGNRSTLELRIKQDATGSRVVDFWPATITWKNNTIPTLTTTANKSDFIICKWDGTTDWCDSSLNY